MPWSKVPRKRCDPGPCFAAECDPRIPRKLAAQYWPIPIPLSAFRISVFPSLSYLKLHNPQVSRFPNRAWPMSLPATLAFDGFRGLQPPARARTFSDAGLEPRRSHPLPHRLTSSWQL